MKKPTLQTILTDIEKVRGQAEADLGRVDGRALAGHTIAKRNASDKLVALQAQYAEVLSERLGGIFVAGPKDVVSAFVAEAVEKGPAVAVAADGLFEKLAGDVEPTMRTDREFQPQQFWNFGVALSRVCTDAGISTPKISFKQKTCRTRQDLVNHLRSLVQAASGDNLTRAFMLKEISTQALKTGYALQALPVIVTGATEGEQNSLGSELFGGRFVGISFDESTTLNEETLAKVFQGLKKQFNKKQ